MLYRDPRLSGDPNRCDEDMTNKLELIDSHIPTETMPISRRYIKIHETPRHNQFLLDSDNCILPFPAENVTNVNGRLSFQSL